MRLEGLSREAAIAKAKSIRPIIDPTVGRLMYMLQVPDADDPVLSSHPILLLRQAYEVVRDPSASGEEDGICIVL